MSDPEHSSLKAWPFIRLFLDGAAASCIAEALTLPLEVSKMRLQTIAKEEKWHSLFKGLEAGMHKQILYTGLRLGLYDYITGFSGFEEVSTPAKIACATMTTGIGVLVANPSDVVQTRYIAYRSVAAAHGGPSSASSVGLSGAPVMSKPVKPVTQQIRQSSTLAAMQGASSRGQRFLSSSTTAAPLQCTERSGRAKHCMQSDMRLRGSLAYLGFKPSQCSSQLRWSHSACGVKAQSCAATGPTSVTGVPLASARSSYGVILREEGLINGLYRGIAANLCCSCVQGAAEITTYDLTKEAALKRGFPDSMPLHLAAGMAAGLLATVVSNPLDVVATRMMAAKNTYSVHMGTMATIVDIWQREGVGAFYTGFVGNILRITSFNIVLWLSYEQIRKAGKDLAILSH